MVLIILWISALQTVYEYIVAHLYSPVEGCCLQVKYYMKSEMEVPPWRLIVHELFSSKAIAGHKTKWSVKVQSFKKTILWNQLTVIFNFKSFQYKIKSVTLMTKQIFINLSSIRVEKRLQFWPQKASWFPFSDSWW